MNGKKLRDLRKKHKLTQKAFCEIFQVAQPTLSLWENEEREPEPQMIKKIANYFQVSIDFLMDNEESIKENELVKLERMLDLKEKQKLMTIIKTMFEDKYEQIKRG